MSRYDEHRGGGAGRPEPVVPAGLADLLAHLAGPPDFWDRPGGDFGPLSEAYELTRAQRAHANSRYRLGSKALVRGELRQAADWLGSAAAAGHPGALFRLAALTARVGGGDGDGCTRLRPPRATAAAATDDDEVRLRLPFTDDAVRWRPPFGDDNTRLCPPFGDDDNRRRPPVGDDDARSRPPFGDDNTRLCPPFGDDNARLCPPFTDDAVRWRPYAPAPVPPSALVPDDVRLHLVADVRVRVVEDVRFLVAEAARHGHGDARALLAASAGRTPAGGAPDARRIEDPQFIDEVRAGMSLGRPAARTPRLPGLAPGLVPVPAPRPRPGSAGRTPLTDKGVERPPGRGIGQSPGHGSGSGALPTPGPGPDSGTGPGPVPSPGSAPGPRVGPVPSPDPVPVQNAAPAPRVGPVPPPGQDSGHPPAPGTGSRSDRLLLPPGLPLLTAAARPSPTGERDTWSANALRPAVLTDMARGTLARTDTPEQWKAAVKALDILYLVDEAGGTSTRALARRSGLPLPAVTWLLHWLRGQHFVSTVAGAHFPGPLMGLTGDPQQRARLLQQTLAGLRDDLGAAVYVSGYTDGDVTVFQSAHGPQAPAVREWVDFRDAAHASAVGKSLLAQLDFAGRMDHLARHRPIRLTSRTITNPRALFQALDGHGPLAAQFDLLEYSHHEVCAAFSLGIPGRAASVALSLPAGQRHRLLDAAGALSERSAGLLLVLLLTEQADSGRRPPPRPAGGGAEEARDPAQGPARGAPTARALPRVPAGVSLTRGAKSASA
ncbi:IclR family transcriptional regulator C-terminal domain-containing protein [Streptomyces sp. NPDC059070]|uniref:IclR family transcriptional regulator domain-containing protein n=1 Tax=Streptomyces sp. NPDC059070 TaxID=3346713 RepID=UPI0036A663A7